jgi:cyclic beta-1,2-glucan synthetase
LSLTVEKRSGTPQEAGSTASDDQGPMRGVALSVADLEARARTLSSTFILARNPRHGTRLFFQRFRENEDVLRRAQEVLAGDVHRAEAMPPAAEWLLDNYNLIESEIMDLFRNFPRKYYASLPKLVSPRGTARVYAMALEIIRHSDARLDAERLEKFVTTFQMGAPLTMGELWAWPIMLKAGLLENLRRLASELLDNRTSRLKADHHFKALDARGKNGRMPARASTAYLVQLFKRMREQDLRVVPLRAELEERLSGYGMSAEEAIRAEHQWQANLQIATANSVTSLRFCSSFDWNRFFERVSLVEQVLKRDPAAVYAKMDFASRDRYRHAVEELADPTGEAQQGVALQAVENARKNAAERRTADAQDAHVGHFLIGKGRRALEKDVSFHRGPLYRLRGFFFAHAVGLYLGTIAGLTIGMTALATLAVQGWSAKLAVALLTVLPASEAAIGLIQWLVCAWVPPRRLPRLDLQREVPEEGCTMVVIPTLLTSVDGVRDLLEHLEVQAIGNMDPRISFAILGDFTDAPKEEMPADAAILAEARAGIEALNRRHGPEGRGPFFLFHRKRLWNPSEECWMGWERKRGKIEEFNRLLRGDKQTSYTTQVGDFANHPTVRFVITLDRDTRLPRDTAKALIGIMLHPLQRPRFDPQRRRVVEGFSVLQPRISVTLSSASGSLFSRFHAGETGLDPYTSAVSDAYQDLFGEGSYSGKGLYEVDAFRATLEGRVPENSLLSHDLFEGIHARVAFVSDVEVADDYPANIVLHAQRQHRWARGDWQLIPWLLPWIPEGKEKRSNDLPVLGLWKILDNLRRSLVPLSLFLGFVAAWTLLPGSPLLWTLGFIGVAALPVLRPLMHLGIGPDGREPIRVFIMRSLEEFRITGAQVLITVLLIPYHAWLMTHAIAVTGMRVIVTRKNLLVWEAAAQAQASRPRTPADFLKAMIVSPLSAVAAGGAALLIGREGAILSAIPLLGLWIASPFVAEWLSRPIPTVRVELSAADRARLRRLARKTWRYFDTFMTEEHHGLPPDNYQEDPVEALAARTSPTNIGMGLISTVVAYELGYISAGRLAERLQRTVSTIESLERVQGHLLNWYETKTLAPLMPRYISTVDSGNLAAALLSLSFALKRNLRGRPRHPSVLCASVRTTAGLLEEAVEPFRRSRPSVPPGVTALIAHLDMLNRAFAAVESEEENLKGLPSLVPRFQEVLRSLESGEADASLTEIRYWLRELTEVLGRGPDGPLSGGLSRTLEDIAERANRLAEGMNFNFLYDSQRKLFAIGYRLPDVDGPGRLDKSYYDLLASEARLASFVAIAKGDVPQSHWFHLNRALISLKGRVTLVSWSASMFEYLMPLIFMRSFPNTLLDQSCRVAVQCQVDYVKDLDVPWGISESAFNLVDLRGYYQYKAFGVPGLGMKRGLGDDLVIAPYATALAAMVDAPEAARNLAKFAKLGLDARYGLYESVDFTPPRKYQNQVPEQLDSHGGRKRGVVIQAYMAHHQGMILASLANVLLDSMVVEDFHSDPRVQSTELLLQERVTRLLPVKPLRSAELTHADPSLLPEAATRLRTPHTVHPRTHFLSNGRYTAIVTNGGGGASFAGGKALTRWRADGTRDAGSQFLYLRDVRSGAVWSATHQPVGKDAEEYRITFLPEKAAFQRRDEGIESLLEIAVSPEDDVEVRRLSLTNRSDRVREIEITSYVELALARPGEDLAHPAFGKLFLETSYLPAYSAILCNRRPRDPVEPGLWAVHVLSVEGRMQDQVEWETDRARFLGRGRGLEAPAAMDGRTLSGTTGAVLDAIASLRTRVRLAPGGFARVAFATGTAPNHDAAVSLAGRYHNPSQAGRTFALAFTDTQIELRHLGITREEARLFLELASPVFFTDHSLRAEPAILALNKLGQSGLWKHGISGDLPMLLVHITEDRDLGLARQVLKAHEFWRLKGLTADVILLNDHQSGYRDEIHERLAALMEAGSWAAWKHKAGGIYLLKSDALTEEDRSLLSAASQAVLSGERGDLQHQIPRHHPEPRWPAKLEVPARPDTVRPYPERDPVPPTLTMWNGLGGFTSDGREYVIVLDGDRETPLPWANILANPDFGTVVTASGAAFTWAENSRENRLTPFANDPVTDPTGETIYFRDDEDGRIWTATPAPLPHEQRAGRWVVRHTAGRTSFEHSTRGIAHELSVFVHPEDPVKFSRVTLENLSSVPRRLSLYFYNEWLLGPPRERHQFHAVTEFDPETGAIFARNPYTTDYPGRIGFAALSDRPTSVTGDRLEFIGRHGTPGQPAALGRRHLAQRFGAGFDPCAAIHLSFVLGPGERRSITHLLGQARDRDEARNLLARHAGAASEVARDVERRWDAILGVVQVRTPDDSFDLIMNRWLLYQDLSSRLWGRTGYYQPGGAFGFRDQIQDVMALGFTRPDLFREHLLKAAAHQFVEGDVQHWWLPPGNRGIRTLCSDDLLWLPYAAAEYVGSMGDETLLKEVVPFLKAPPLKPGEAESYSLHEEAPEKATLYEHCTRAIDRSLTYGSHGLPLIGSCDWNDGMNRVGMGGRGESAWLGWFLYSVLTQFARIAESHGEGDRAARYRKEAQRLSEMLDLAWDGDWYRRAYFDDGTPIGSVQNEECRIDAIAQSWAVLSGGAPPRKAERAMDAVRTHLIRRGLGLVLLLTPPWDKSERDPGYIKGYVPGIRENGGQYTQASVWTGMALARLGSGDEAMELFHMLNPINHTRTEADVEKYKTEPYVIAGDVYAHPLHLGRGGWTWYTGSAGWSYRMGLESLLGLARRGSVFSLDPCIPTQWKGYSITWSIDGTRYEITVENPKGRCRGVTAAWLDDQPVDAGSIPIIRDRNTHKVRAVLGDKS